MLEVVQDWLDIDFAIQMDVDFIAVSFVKTADVINNLKSYLSSRSSKVIEIVAKIESHDSVPNAQDIIEASDAVMIARGDLGMVFSFCAWCWITLCSRALATSAACTITAAAAAAAAVCITSCSVVDESMSFKQQCCSHHVWVSLATDSICIMLWTLYLLMRRHLEQTRVLQRKQQMQNAVTSTFNIIAATPITPCCHFAGAQIPLEDVPSVQKEIVMRCRQQGKPVIVASHLLQSMIEYPTPTRAEVADISDVVRQRADALMLSGESAAGAYPDKAVAVLRAVSGRIEEWCRSVSPAP